MNGLVSKCFTLLEVKLFKDKRSLKLGPWKVFLALGAGQSDGNWGQRMRSELDGRGGSEVVSSEEISKGKIPTFYQRRKKSKGILFFFFLRIEKRFIILFTYKGWGEGSTEDGEDTAGRNTERIISWRILEEMGRATGGKEKGQRKTSSPLTLVSRIWKQVWNTG